MDIKKELGVLALLLLAACGQADSAGYYFRTERSEVIAPCFAVAAVNGGEQNGSNQMYYYMEPLGEGHFSR